MATPDADCHDAVASVEATLRLQAIFDSAVDFAIIATDRNGHVTDWNVGAERVLGWTADEMRGDTVERIFTPEDRAVDRAGTEMRVALEAGRASDERWHLRRDGSRFWASGEMMPLRDRQNSHIGFLKILRDRTAEHEAGMALRNLEGDLERAQVAGGVGVFTIDVADNVLKATPEFCRIFGVPVQNRMSPELIEALIAPEHAEVRSSKATRARGDVNTDVDYRIRRADTGEIRWLNRRSVVECDQNGTPLRFVGVVRDVTEQRAIGEALARSEMIARQNTQRVQLALEAGAIIGTWLWDMQADRVTVDEAFARSFGLDPSLGREGIQLAQIVATVHPDDQAGLAAAIDAAIARGGAYAHQYRVRRADGEYYWIEANGRVEHAQDGTPVSFPGVLLDIEERRAVEAERERAVAALRELNANLERIVTERALSRGRTWQVSPDLLVVINNKGFFEAINPAWTTLLGWSEEELTNAPFSDFIHPDDQTATQAVWLDAIERNLPALRFENRYRHKNGTWHWLSWVGVPDEGKVYCSARDVTADKEQATALAQAEEALRQSQKMEAVGQLTGGVAHDFNNLLTIIRSSIDMLKRPALSEERRDRYVAAISDTVDRAAKLTSQLLAFARRQVLKPVVFAACDSVRSLSDMMDTLTGSRIRVTTRLPPIRCFVHADASQFDTALVNLAVNARDAMNSEGRLVITVEPVEHIPAIRPHAAMAGAYVAVSISDDGSGIPSHMIDQIFEPFFTTKEIGKGTGLGLSQVFGFAKQSGGDVAVQSTLGEGTTFTIYLPRVAGPEQEQTREEADDLSSADTLRVLVVEDNVDVGTFAVHTLHDLGHDAACATDGLAALARLAQDPDRFDVVFSDVMMPGMSGIELGQEIRRLYHDLPVVLTSGYSHVLAQNGDYGFELLHKPYSIDQLSHVLRKAVSWRKRNRL